ncbi:MAG: glycosyltransferase family 4 protein [Candidatus Latescibacterota bacterium]|nr:glycosyltransferase family 4 protein [Candidatus Latescibacterota bacterium]
MSLRYGVVADGSLRIAHEKGEVKDRYWNPGHIFDEVHVITLADDDVTVELVQRVAGQAKLVIHPVGRPRVSNPLALRRRVLDVFTRCQPHVIRGHGPFLQGYYAVWAARQLGIPSYASIHDDVSIYRRFWTYGQGYAKITLYQLTMKALGWERYVYANADCLVPKYEAAARLIRGTRHRDKVRVIYNQIFLDRFQDQRPRLKEGDRLRIINVGRQFAGKDQRPLIRSLAHVDAELTLVGRGPFREAYAKTARKAGVQDGVTFIDRVANADLPKVFEGHHVFAINIIQPGVCMPVLEAMALGYPIVINEPRWGGSPEVCGGCADVVPGTPAGFATALSRFLADPDRVADQGRRSREVIPAYSGEAMEKKERDLILEMLSEHRVDGA